MTEQERELQKQIDELKAVVDRLQSGKTRYVNMSITLKNIRNEAFEKYFGNIKDFKRGVSTIQVSPQCRAWYDYDYLRDGMTKLINILYKHSVGVTTQMQISNAVKTQNDLDIYTEIAHYIVDMMVEKYQELQVRQKGEQMQTNKNAPKDSAKSFVGARGKHQVQDNMGEEECQKKQ